MSVNTCPDRDSLLTDFGKRTLSDRYVLEGEGAQEVFARVSQAFADDDAHAQRMYDYMSNLWFMPATPVLANGGTDRGLPISCFLQSVEDTLPSIINTFQEMAWLSSGGGGIGIYWGNVRETGAKVRDRGASEGVSAWANIQNSYTRSMNQGDIRTASSALYLDVDHPDIESFLEIREPKGDLTRKALNCHHGVGLTKDFLDAVDAGTEYELFSRRDGSVVKRLDARTIWTKMLDLRLRTGEPYMLFLDNVARGRSQVYRTLDLEVTQSNLCTEIMLRTGIDHKGNDRSAVCCLSSVNAETYLEWKDHPTFIEDCLRFLDNVLENFIQTAKGRPGYDKAVYSAERERAVGLGVMGWHGYLMSLGVPFASPMAKGLNMKFFRELRHKADAADIKLGQERGPCPDARDAGLPNRFSHKLAIAPTASISIICGGSTPGIEPVPGMEWVQKTDSGSVLIRCKQFEKWLQVKWDEIGNSAMHAHFEEFDYFEAEVWTWVKDHEGSIQGFPWFTAAELAVWETGFDMDQMWIIEQADDRADDICQGQSVNVFFKGDADKGYINRVHRKAAKSRLKSLYYLRSTSVQKAGAVGHDSVGSPDVSFTAIDEVECLACQ